MLSESRIGLALGGGGARGVAHILVCEVFDELGIKPALIAGTSIGAIVGAAYATGLQGRDIRERVCAFYARRRDVLTKLWRARPLAFTDLLRGRSLSPQFDARLILDTFVPSFERLPETFAELAIPLKIVACDFYAASEVVLEKGELKPAIAASIAIPALFRPVMVNGRYLIDGGACNPLPFDHIAECAITVASDVTGGPSQLDRAPRLMECVVGAAQISMQSVIREKLKSHQPNILVRPEINGIFIMDFLKTQAILDMNVAFKDDLKRRLDTIVNTPFDDPVPSPALPKEVAEKSGRRRLTDSGINLWHMMAGGRLKEADPVLDAAALRVSSGVVEPANASERNGRGA